MAFIDLNKLDLKNIKTTLQFDKGKITIKPFNLNYEDVNIEISGSHSFINELVYTTTFEVPAKYFGSQLGGILFQLSNKDIKVPIIASIAGTMSTSKITTDMKKSVNNLSNQLIKVEKDKLMKQGTKLATDALGDVLGKNDEGIIGNLIGGNKDSINTNKNIQKDVKNVLGWILGKRKIGCVKRSNLII